MTTALAAQVENLTLTGTAALNGTGNALDNMITGNAAANTLKGGEGDDTFGGGAGNDMLTDTSATSSDTYRWGLGMGSDSLANSGGALDHVGLFAGITLDQLTFV